MNKKLEDIIKEVEDWSIEKGIDQASWHAQWKKFTEEKDELLIELSMGNELGTKDELGDVMVTLVILHQILGLTIEDTLGEAYAKIKDRKGKTINGMFVKESDLNGR